LSDLVQRARLLLDVHRPEEALRVLAQAVARDPEDPQPHIVAGMAYLDLNEPALALEAARSACALNPQSASATRVAGIASAELGRSADALKYGKLAVRIDPADDQSHALLAELQVLRGQKCDAISRNRLRKKAIRSAEQAISLAPENPYAHYVMGRVLLDDGRLRAAEQAFHHVLSLDPSHTAALSALSETLALTGRPSDAAELLQMAARSDFRDISIHQDMLRYVRGAGSGLATWPIIGLLGVFFSVAIAENPPVGVAYGALAVGLAHARRRRLHHFPPAVRRMLNRRSFTREGWEVGGLPAFRPWWWQLIVRIPLLARVVAYWAFVSQIYVIDSGRHVPSAVLGGIGVLLTGHWIRQRRKARASHPLYSRDADRREGAG
jgi:Flp pilus assembly protein TadD